MWCFPRCDSIPRDTYEVYIHPKVLSTVYTLPHTTIQGTCLLDITQETLAALAKNLGLTLSGIQGHGRLGRIYFIENSPYICKVSSVDISGTYEMHNYSLLRSKNIPCPQVILSSVQDFGGALYTISVLECMDFTLTALLRACRHVRYIQGLDVALEALLQALADAGLVVVDLSPDNIMLQRTNEQNIYAIRIIDPQFVTSLKEFQRRAGKASEFDRVYLGLKIYIIGLVHPRSRNVTTRVCRKILGYVPLERHAIKWLMHEGQMGGYSNAQFLLQP